MKGSGIKRSPLWILSFGLNLTACGQMIFWVEGFQLGLFNVFGVFLILLSAYICLNLCLAEISSCLPFSGGSYALARVTGGPLLGYIVGCADRMDLLFNIGLSMMIISWIITNAFEIRQIFSQILCWLVVYLLGCFNLWVPTYERYWWAMAFSTILYFVVLTVFIIGCSISADFGKGLSVPSTLVVSGEEFLSLFPHCLLFFSGLQFIQMGAVDVVNPKQNIPRLILTGVVAAFVIGIVLLFLVASNTPRELYYSNDFPLTIIPALSSMFHASPKFVSLLLLPTFFAGFQGNLFAIHRVSMAMLQSNLLICLRPESWTWITLEKFQLVRFGLFLLFVMVISFSILQEEWFWIVAQMAMLGTMTSQCINLFSFIVFRVQFGSLQRGFVSPIGIAGAVYPVFIFVLVILGILARGRDGRIAVCLYLFMMFFSLVIYQCRLKDSQKFSAEEEAALFVAHVIRHNAEKNKRMKRRASRLTSSASFMTRSQSSMMLLTGSSNGNGVSFRGGLPVFRKASGASRAGSGGSSPDSPPLQRAKVHSVVDGDDAQQSASSATTGFGVSSDTFIYPQTQEKSQASRDEPVQISIEQTNIAPPSSHLESIHMNKQEKNRNISSNLTDSGMTTDISVWDTPPAVVDTKLNPIIHSTALPQGIVAVTASVVTSGSGESGSVTSSNNAVTQSTKLAVQRTASRWQTPKQVFFAALQESSQNSSNQDLQDVENVSKSVSGGTGSMVEQAIQSIRESPKHASSAFHAAAQAFLSQKDVQQQKSSRQRKADRRKEALIRAFKQSTSNQFPITSNKYKPFQSNNINDNIHSSKNNVSRQQSVISDDPDEENQLPALKGQKQLPTSLKHTFASAATHVMAATHWVRVTPLLGFGETNGKIGRSPDEDDDLLLDEYDNDNEQSISVSINARPRNTISSNNNNITSNNVNSINAHNVCGNNDTRLDSAATNNNALDCKNKDNNSTGNDVVIADMNPVDLIDKYYADDNFNYNAFLDDVFATGPSNATDLDAVTNVASATKPTMNKKTKLAGAFSLTSAVTAAIAANRFKSSSINKNNNVQKPGNRSTTNDIDAIFAGRKLHRIVAPDNDDKTVVKNQTNRSEESDKGSMAVIVPLTPSLHQLEGYLRIETPLEPRLENEGFNRFSPTHNT